LQLTAVIDPSASSAKKLTWATSSPSVALVSETGLVTALAGGLATITATSASDKTRFGSSTMTFVTVDAKKLELKLALTADVILLQATGVGTSVGMVPLSVSSSYSDAIGAAQIVHGNPSATYNQVDSAITALGTATATFTEAKVTPLGASKTSLLVALAAANTLKNSTSLKNGSLPKWCTELFNSFNSAICFSLKRSENLSTDNFTFFRSSLASSSNKFVTASGVTGRFVSQI
jgi:hypothetical protein